MHAGIFPLYVQSAPAVAVAGVFRVAVGVVAGQVRRGAGWSRAALGRVGRRWLLVFKEAGPVGGRALAQLLQGFDEVPPRCRVESFGKAS